ncbi:hypothetical protein, partial [Leeia sp.]|uniref:hypothetical protein n=1 Tax=Leeia sp. TaxID=2884678 RepID=UPI0035B3515B
FVKEQLQPTPDFAKLSSFSLRFVVCVSSRDANYTHTSHSRQHLSAVNFPVSRLTAFKLMFLQ